MKNIIEKTHESKFIGDNLTTKQHLNICNNNESIDLLLAGTGAGKSYYIVHQLIDQLTRDCKKVLILCNRTALKKQFEKDILKAKTDSFNQCFVTTYQYLDSQEWDLEILAQYDYIICDEVHYVLQDSTFNNSTDKILELLLLYHKQQLGKILFCTATEFELLPFLQLHGYDLNTNNFNVYDGNLELNWWDRIDIHCTSKPFLDVAKTVPDDEKCLIFIKGKGMMKSFAERLGNADFIHSQWITQEDGQLGLDEEIKVKIDKLLKTQTFDTKYLITNASLDNGVNVRDPKLTTIIINNIYDLVSVIQMVGRKRFDENNPNDRIKVYLINNLQGIKDEYDETCKYIKMYEDFNSEMDKSEFCKKYEYELQDRILVGKKVKEKLSPIYIEIDLSDMLNPKSTFIIRNTLMAKLFYKYEYLKQLQTYTFNANDYEYNGFGIEDFANLNYRVASLISEKYNKNTNEIIIDRGMALITLQKKNEIRANINTQLLPYLESCLNKIYVENDKIEILKDKFPVIEDKTEFREMMKEFFGIQSKSSVLPSKSKINGLLKTINYEVIEKKCKVNRVQYKHWIILKR